MFSRLVIGTGGHASNMDIHVKIEFIVEIYRPANMLPAYFEVI